jgi:hypothetical protein
MCSVLTCIDDQGEPVADTFAEAIDDAGIEEQP